MTMNEHLAVTRANVSVFVLIILISVKIGIADLMDKDSTKKYKPIVYNSQNVFN